MKTGEKLFHFLAKLVLEKFYGSVTIRFEHGKVTHVETETKRMWQYKDLPHQMSDIPGTLIGVEASSMAGSEEHGQQVRGKR